MITHKILEERIILETSDFNKSGLSTYVRLSPEYYILSGHEKRYIVRKIDRHNYEVLGIYDKPESKIDLDAIRRSGI